MSGHAGSSKETLCSANMHFFFLPGAILLPCVIFSSLLTS